MASTVTADARREAGWQRLEALRARLEELEIDILLVFGNGRHAVASNFVWWLSGVRQLGRDAVVALPRAGDPVLLTTPSWDRDRSRARGWIGDVVAVDDLAAELAAFLEARTWRSAGAGVAALRDASPRLADSVDAAFTRPPSDADDAVLEAAAVHDAWALASIERAVEIADAGYRRMCEVARPGMREFELHAEVDAHVRMLGADDDFLLLSASQHNRAVHAPTDRELAVGDVILAEISPSVDGQFAQICRTAVIGEPDQRQLAGYEVLCEGYEAGLASVRPGVPVSEVARAINRVISDRGYEKYTRPPYMRTRGHAMGLGAMVPADISERSSVVLEPGMSFVLHPNQYLPEVGYFLCGNQVIVTDDGARALPPALPTLDAIEARVPA